VSAGIFVVTLCAFMASGAALPILPTYVHGPLHAGDVAVGIVVGSFAVTSVICRPIAGRQADRRGRRVVLVVGSLALALGGLMYLAADNVATLVLARLVVGVGEGSVYTAGAAWTVDISPPERRGMALGMFGLAVWGGFSLGPVAGELLRSSSGYDAAWILAATLPLIGAVVALRLPEPERARTVAPLTIQTLFPRAARRPGVALALANIGYAALAGFVILDLQSRGIGGGTSVFTAFAVAVFTSRLALGRLPDRLGARVVATGAGITESLGLTIIALSHSLLVALAGAAVVGAGFSMLFPSWALLVVADADEAHRGSAMGIFTAFVDFGVGVGGPLSGETAVLAGYPAVFFMSALAALATAVLAMLPRHGRRSHLEQSSTDT
jgi:MFS family permease